MDAMMIKPPDFNPSRKYPVYQFTYAGPTAAVVRNAWGGSDYLFHQLLAQRGAIVWLLDNRSAGGKGGAEAQWSVYGNLGAPELRDLEDGITWLKQQPYIDASRIILSGWSYGGFMTAYALTHSTSWSGGIVGAPVTDWRDYDTVYTERLMKLPQNNLEGYRTTAPRSAAANLKGRMLLLHGEMDDNVHMQNSIPVRVRAAAAWQAVRDDGLCEIETRVRRPLVDQEPSADDARFHHPDARRGPGWRGSVGVYQCRSLRR
jgi:dipeptidyl-peptidase-4